MHIAFFTNTYHPVVSGVVRSVETFRQALTELHHNVFIFAQQANDYQDTTPFVFRYPTLEINLGQDVPPMVIPVSRFVNRLLPSLKPQVIHSHHPFLLGEAAAGKAEDLDIPLVFTFHTRYREYSHYVMGLEQDFVKQVTQRWLCDYLRRCHHIVVPSNSIKKMLADDYGVTRQVTTVPTGIDLTKYRQAEGRSVRQAQGWGDDTVLISVGRLAQEKNWRTLIRAAAQVMADHPKLRLALIGDGVEREALQKFSQELGVAEQVEFVGRVPFEEIPNYLKAADIFCFASVTETQGLVTMEALAAELPVVAVAASGTSDVVEDGKQGLLTDNDSDALAQAIARLVDDTDLRAQFKAVALERAEVFDTTEQAGRLLDVYDQAIEDHKAGRHAPVKKPEGLLKKMIMNSDAWSALLGLNEGDSGRP